MSQNNTNQISIIEMQEIMDKLKNAGFSEIVDCLLDHEKDCYTKKGRLNKSSTCRRLNWKSKKLEDAIEQMRELLKNEFNIEDCED